jgi:methionyl-tRNA formyltransferase
LRVAILTAHRTGVASCCLPPLLAQPGVELPVVIFDSRQQRNRWRQAKRILRKTIRIGPAGALVGLSIRKWYSSDKAEDIFTMSPRHGVRVESTPSVNHERTRQLLSEYGIELGISLGNGYIGKKTFSTPKYGMINVHGEVLPRFRGARSVIWAIYEGIPETGFTIHQIDEGIDTGTILHVERFPMVFGRTLSETVCLSIQEINRRVPTVLANVVGNYLQFRAGAKPQAQGRSYTTPTLRQFLQMRWQHKRLREAYGRSVER